MPGTAPTLSTATIYLTREVAEGGEVTVEDVAEE